jgi:hypothetical protein
MFNKQASEASLLNKCICLAEAVGVTKFITYCYDLGLTLLCCLSLT